jgi:hypothetical protein
VTLEADRVAREFELAGMGVVAVGAGDALLEHEALAEGGVDIDLIKLLAVSVIEPLNQKAREEVVQDRLTRRR